MVVDTDDPEPDPDSDVVEELPDDWGLDEHAEAFLDDLIALVRRLIRYARSGADLIPIGETWGALENITSGRPVEVNVELTIGFRDGDQEFSEGIYFGLRVNWGEVRLGKLTTVYSCESGGDHSSENIATLVPCDGLSGDVGSWLEQVEELLADERTKLTWSRDHL